MLVLNLNSKKTEVKHYPWIWLLLVVSCSIITGLLFLPSQSIWTDETSQLTGLSLPLAKLIPWLLHKTESFGLPFDRMPPLSYLMGKIWIQFFGLSITSLRIFGILCVASGTAILFHTAYRSFGTKSAIVSSLLFALSPNVIVFSNEIRAYPIFLLLSSLGFFFYSKLVTEVNNKNLLSFVIVSLLMIYNHYFGLVFFGATFLSLAFFHYWALHRRAIWQLSFSLGIVTFLSLGIIPFVLAANSSSKPETCSTSSSFYQIVRLGYRLIAHASIALHPVILSLFFISAFGLTLSILFKKKRYRKVSFTYIVPVIVGLVTAIFAAPFFCSFNAAKIHYYSWMIPGICLFFGSALYPSVRWWTIALVVTMIASLSFGTFQLITNGSFFSHGPYEKLANMIKKTSPDKTVIVYEPESNQAGMAYFPLLYLFGESLDQYHLSVPDLDPLIPSLPPNRMEELESKLAKYNFVFASTVQRKSAREITHYIRSGVHTWPMGTLSHILSNSPNWELIDNQTLIAWTSVQVYIFKNKKYGKS